MDNNLKYQCITLVLKLDSMAREHNIIEYGLPIVTEGIDKYTDAVEAFASEIKNSEKTLLTHLAYSNHGYKPDSCSVCGDVAKSISENN